MNRRPDPKSVVLERMKSALCMYHHGLLEHYRDQGYETATVEQAVYDLVKEGRICGGMNEVGTYYMFIR